MMRRFKDSDESELDPNSAEAKRREAFKVFDMDGNGYIDKHELKYVMRRLGENLSDDDLKAMFNEADLNGDGYIDFEGELNEGEDTSETVEILEILNKIMYLNYIG